MSDLLRNAILFDTECVSGDTLVQLSSGHIVEIENYESGLLWGSCIEDQTRIASSVHASNLIKKGNKECFEVKASWGLPIKASAGHAFLTQDGWKQVSEMSCSDYILLQTSGPQIAENSQFTDKQLDLVGWFIAEGCRCAPEHPRHLSLSVAEKSYIELLPNPWPEETELSVCEDNNQVRYYSIRRGRRSDGSYYVSRAAEFIQSLGLLDKYSYEKTFPQKILECSSRQIARVVSAMWAGDGTVNKDRLGLSYSTTSKRLAEQLVLVLNRFGILSSLSSCEDNRKESYKTVWTLQISGDSVIRFAEVIPLFGRKANELKLILDKFSRRASQQRIPYVLMDGWQQAWKEYCTQHNIIQFVKVLKEAAKETVSNAFYHSIDMTVSALKNLAKHFPEVFEQYLKYCFVGMTWAKVQSITAIGTLLVFDITTETAEFFANGIVVHNTTNLSRGAGLREGSVFNLQSKKAIEYILSPNRVRVTPSIPQDLAKFRAGAADVHTREIHSLWESVIQSEILEQAGIQSHVPYQETLKWQNSFLLNAINSGNFPQVNNVPGQEASRLSRLQKLGIDVEQRNSTVQQMIADLPGLMKGKTIWIQNTQFESKQIGAQLSADSNVDFKQKLNLETYNPKSADPFYVTGVEVNRARVSAQITGDWRGVYKAYRENTPKAGQTAVRDIQDVLRAVISYGKEEKLFSGGSHYFGTGIDISHKLMAMAAGDMPRAMVSEAHRATEDVAVHEAYVLEKSVQHAETMRHVTENTAEGQLYRKMAQRGEGPLAEATRYYSLLEQAAPHLQRENLIKRLQRAQIDIFRTGETHQSIGITDTFYTKQNSPEGEVQVLRSQHGHRKFTSMDSYVSHLEASPEYSSFINPAEEISAFRKAATSVEATNLYSDAQVALSRSRIKLDELIPSLSRLQSLRASEGTGTKLLAGLSHDMRGMAGLAGAGLVGLVALDLMSQKPRPSEQKSLIGFGYQEWLDAQEGMASQGLAKENRSKNTDFGSPYRGPVVSSQVFKDQEMLNAREKWLRQQYGATHYDSNFGLFGELSPFHMRKGYSFIGQGEKVEAGYAGLRGNNLVKVNLKDGWKLSVEDADTVVLKRGGVTGAISSFFGMNDGYSFRLAGIDAPELSHQGRSAQPYSEQAKAKLQEMLDNSKNTEVVFDPTNITYGRMLAGVIGDDKNLNLEMVKQGTVAHLPFGNPEKSIVDYDSMKRAEDRAYNSRRGLWNEPYFQAIHQIAGNSRPTFNTLVNYDKIAENSSQMNMVAAANAAQAQGHYTNSLGEEAGHLNKFGDNVGPSFFDKPSGESLRDPYSMTHADNHKNQFNKRGGYGKLEQYMALDSMGSTNSVWTKRRYGVFDMYDTDNQMKAQRQQRMAEQQRMIVSRMFQSPINHTRM